MEGLVGKEDFVYEPGLDLEPVEVDEGGGDVQGLMQLRTLAEEFWTYWNRSRALLGTPNRTPLQ